MCVQSQTRLCSLDYCVCLTSRTVNQKSRTAFASLVDVTHALSCGTRAQKTTHTSHTHTQNAITCINRTLCGGVKQVNRAKYLREIRSNFFFR